MHLNSNSRIQITIALMVFLIVLPGCTGSIRAQEEGPRLIVEEDTTIVCEGETARIEVTITGEPDVWLIYTHNGVSYPPISNSSNTFILRIDDPGMYIITEYGDANRPGSDPADTFYVRTFPAPDIAFSGGGVNCSGGILDPLVVHFTGDPSFWLYFIFNGVRDSLETVLSQLTFPTDQSFTLQTIRIADRNCSREVDITAHYVYIDVPDPEVIGLPELCEGTTEIYRAASSDYPANWEVSSGGEYTEGSDEEGNYVEVDWTEPGTHQIALRYTEEEYNCSTEWIWFPVVVNPLPEVFDRDTNFCFELESNLDITVEIAEDETIYWPELNRSTSTVSVEETGTFHYILTSAEECADTGSIRITSSCHPELYVPEAFTPDNGDDLNDELRIYGFFTTLDFRIYSSSGVLLFRTTEDPLEYWDGTYNGKELPPGTYYWYAVLSGGTGESLKQAGEVTLIK